MSNGNKILVPSILAAAFGLWCWHLWGTLWQPVVAQGTGPGGAPVPNWLGLVVSLIAAIGAGKFGTESMSSVIELVKQLVLQWIPAGNPFRKVAEPAITIGQVALYAQIYKNAKTDEERTVARAAARLAYDAEFDEMFPVDAVKVEVVS